MKARIIFLKQFNVNDSYMTKKKLFSYKRALPLVTGEMTEPCEFKAFPIWWLGKTL